MSNTSPRVVTALHRSALALAVAAGIMILSSCAASVPDGDYPAYASDAEMAETSDAVILGDVTSERFEAIQGLDYRVVSIDVRADAKSLYAPGDLVEVKLLDGSIDDPGPELELNSTYVLFLETYDLVPASLLNPWQAYYEVKDGNVTSGPVNDLALRPDL